MLKSKGKMGLCLRRFSLEENAEIAETSTSMDFQGLTAGQVVTRSLIIVVAITVFFAFFRLGSVRLFDVDEAVFAQAAKEMIETGDWITPTYNGENRFDKPIFFYWMLTASYGVFGINEFSARLPSALSGVFVCLATFFLIRHFRDERRAVSSVLVMVFSLYFFIYSHAAVTDMTLTLFITLSLFCFYCAFGERSVPRGKRDLFILGFHAFAALALLTKGLIGILFPYGVSVLYLLFRRDRASIKQLFSLKGIAVFLLIAVPWFAAELAINGGDFFEQFIIKHHFRRYTGVISGHRGGLFYYIPVLLAGSYPWIVFLPSALKKALRLRDPLDLLALVWLTFIFAFFSFSTTKLPNYILPAMPAVAILISSVIPGRDGWDRVACLVLAAISLTIAAALLLAPRYLSQAGLNDTRGLFVMAAIAGAIAVVGLAAFFAGKDVRAPLAALMAAFLISASLWVLPAAAGYLQGTLYRYSIYVGNSLQAGEKLVAYRINNPSILFYSGHGIVPVRSREGLLSLSHATGRILAIAKSKDAEILRGAGFSVLENDGRYALAEKK
jgi:4-amino-4-deoxy-L-arabinose transferase-like glycosyltransferase